MCTLSYTMFVYSLYIYADNVYKQISVYVEVYVYICVYMFPIAYMTCVHIPLQVCIFMYTCPRI